MILFSTKAFRANGILGENSHVDISSRYGIIMSELADFVKSKRKQVGLTQEEFAKMAGIALTVIRKIEQGKENLNLAKVNQLLQMFGHVLGPINERNNLHTP